MNVTIRELGTGDRRGALFVVSVPIGNDEDLTRRARVVCWKRSMSCSPRTRGASAIWPSAPGLPVDARLVSYHDHNESERVGEVLAQLEQGARVALVSDAGTPLFSDPGYVVVSRAVEQGFAVSPVPGCIVAAGGAERVGARGRSLHVRGLPARAGRRPGRPRSGGLSEQGDAFVVHEAPRRVGGLLADLAAVVPEWQLCIGREVTKVFEEFRRGSATELATEFADAEDARGEFTIVAAPPAWSRAAAGEDDEIGAEQLDRFVRALLEQGVTAKTIAKSLSELPGVSHKAAYARVLALADRR